MSTVQVTFESGGVWKWQASPGSRLHLKLPFKKIHDERRWTSVNLENHPSVDGVRVRDRTTVQTGSGTIVHDFSALSGSWEIECEVLACKNPGGAGDEKCQVNWTFLDGQPKQISTRGFGSTASVNDFSHGRYRLCFSAKFDQMKNTSAGAFGALVGPVHQLKCEFLLSEGNNMGPNDDVWFESLSLTFQT